MSIKDLEKIEKAVDILSPSVFIAYSRYTEEVREARRERDEKILFYIRTGVNPSELLKKALKIQKERDLRQQKERDDRRARQIKEERALKLKQKNCKHDWDEYIIKDHKKLSVGIFKKWTHRECKKCGLIEKNI